MNNESKLTSYQNENKFLFNQMNSSYQSTLSLTNTGSDKLYFKVHLYQNILFDKITSTFGKLITISNIKTKCIEPYKTIVLDLKLKIPNQINKHSQKIIISYSNKQISSKLKNFDDDVFEIKIKFDQNLPEQDQVIKQILQQDCQQLCQQASQLFKKGQIQNSLYKYQESFLLFRQYTDGLYGMSQCLYLMKSWQQALDAIQTALIVHQYQHYVWLKVKIIFELIKQQPSDIQMIRNLKKQIIKITNLENIEAKKQQFINYLQKQEDKISSQKGGKLMFEFIQKAAQSYDSSLELKQIYGDNKTLFEKQLHEVLNVCNAAHNIQETPQYVLDPITYQIMKQPLIVPSGHSYQQKSLLNYIQKHGSKDLYTRQQLRYEWARPNNALKSFIKNSEHLQNWIQYEKQISTFK